MGWVKSLWQALEHTGMPFFFFFFCEMNENDISMFVCFVALDMQTCGNPHSFVVFT